MSGNPFRQRVQLPDSDVLASPSTPPPITTSTSPTSIERKVKKVRIRTPPPLSPDSIHETTPLYRPISQTYENTYFPPAAAFDRSSRPLQPVPSERSVRNSGDELQSVVDLKNVEEMPLTSMVSSSTASAVANPFAKTLETIENAQGRRAAQVPTPHSAMKRRNFPAGEKTPKQAMDVDSFARLLLTGKTKQIDSPAPTTSSSSAIGSNTYIAGTSDSTDTPSQSRQSLDESSIDSAATSPRTSYDAQPPMHDESLSTTPINNESKKKPPPPPPRHRHGKLMGQRMPQVVSFADFTPTDVSLSAARRPSKDLPPIPLERTSSDRSIPVSQPTPPLRRPSQQSVTEEQDSSDEKAPQSPTIPSPSTLPVEPAPPSPSTSFQSKPSRPPRLRADSNLSIPSQHEVLTPSPTDTTNSFKLRPPPPPARRPGGKSNSNHPPIATNIATSPDLHPQPDDPTPVPEPRRGSILVAPSSRSSSISVSNRTLAPPPPPPRRRRGSSKSSVDLTIPAISSPPAVDSNRASFDRLKLSNTGLEDVTETQLDNTVPGPSRGSRGSQDVLSDLDKLQAEVDALRSSYG